MNCKLCDKLIISTAVAVVGENLVITIPEGSYSDGCKYCIVVAQSVPAAATIGSEVLVQIGAAGSTYSLVGCRCRPVTACGIHSRTKYPVIVETTAAGGVFRMLGKVCCPADRLPALEG